MSRPSSTIDPFRRRTWKGPLRVAQERAARADLEVDLDEFERGRWDCDDGFDDWPDTVVTRWSVDLDDLMDFKFPIAPSGVTYTCEFAA